MYIYIYNIDKFHSKLVYVGLANARPNYRHPCPVGHALSSAKKVLLLHHRPPNYYFNILTFGAGMSV